MELTVFFTTLALVFKLGLAVQCYKCEPKKNANLCHLFDSSAKFVVNCSDSTICYKKEVFMDFGNGKATIAITRGCAPQTLQDDQEFINGSWRYVIQEAYEEKCHLDNTYDERTTKNTYCYCRGDLCNGAGGIGKGFEYLCAVFMGFIVLWLF